MGNACVHEKHLGVEVEHEVGEDVPEEQLVEEVTKLSAALRRRTFQAQDDDDTCVICYDDLKDPIELLPCGHHFCANCWDEYQKASRRRTLVCPYDRSEVRVVMPALRREIKERERLEESVRTQNILSEDASEAGASPDSSVPASPTSPQAPVPPSSPTVMSTTASTAASPEASMRGSNPGSPLIVSKDVAAIYLSLGDTMDADEKIQYTDGQTLNQRDAYVAALRHNPRLGAAYTNIGVSLKRDENAVLADGRTLTKRQVYIEAIRHNPSSPAAYTNLGALMGAKEKITLPGGRKLNKQQLHIEAINQNKSFAPAYFNLATTMSVSDSVLLADGRQMTPHLAYLEAIRNSPTFVAAYHNLGQIMEPGSSIMRPNGRSWSRAEVVALGARFAAEEA